MAGDMVRAVMATVVALRRDVAKLTGPDGDAGACEDAAIYLDRALNQLDHARSRLSSVGYAGDRNPL